MKVATQPDPDAGRSAIASYVHHDGSVGVLIEIHASRSEAVDSPELHKLADDLTKHIAALSPGHVGAETDQDDADALLHQGYVMNSDISVLDLVNDVAKSVDSAITIRRFVRYQIDC